MKRVEWIAAAVLCWTALAFGLFAVSVPDGNMLCTGPLVTCQREVAEAMATEASFHAALPVMWATGLVVAGALGMYSIWRSGWRLRRA